MKAVVLTFDRLPAHLLGCYGNEWIETPGFDRLAASGAVFDQHFAELPGPAGPNHSWWTGQFEFFANASGGEAANGSANNWLQNLAKRGVQCRLLSEDCEGLPTDLFYSSETVGGAAGLNAEHDDVPIARLIQRGVELLEGDATGNASASSDEPPELLWLHSRGVPSPWLPPRLFAELYLDELEEVLDGESGSEIASSLVTQFETEPDLVRLLLSDWRRDVDAAEDSVATPASESDSGDSETRELELQISRLVFAGYVSLIDRWLLKLLTVIEERDGNILLIVSANQGRSFGEESALMSDPVRPLRGASGALESGNIAVENLLASRLCDAELRTPLFVAEFSGSSSDDPFGTRHSALAQPVDLPATLQEWFCRDASDSSDSPNETIPTLAGCSLLSALSDDTPAGHDTTFHLGPDGQLGIRNRDWAMVVPDGDLSEDTSVRLFPKPDDQWDVNDVASQYPHEVEAMLVAIRHRTAEKQQKTES